MTARRWSALLSRLPVSLWKSAAIPARAAARACSRKGWQLFKMTAAMLPLAQSAMGQPGRQNAMSLAGSAIWRREHGCTRIGHSRSCSGYPPLDCVQEWRCKSEENDANQDIAGDAEEGRRKQRRGERVAAAAATVRSAGCGGRPRTATPGRGGE